jgi:hypothetical protein
MLGRLPRSSQACPPCPLQVGDKLYLTTQFESPRPGSMVRPPPRVRRQRGWALAHEAAAAALRHLLPLRLRCNPCSAAPTLSLLPVRRIDSRVQCPPCPRSMLLS